MPFTVAAIQFAPTKGDVSANLDRIADLALTAVGEGADLCVFPESAATAYFLEGAAADSAMEPGVLASELTKRLASLTRQVDVLVGFYEPSGGQPHNSAAYIEFGPGQAL